MPGVLSRRLGVFVRILGLCAIALLLFGALALASTAALAGIRGNSLLEPVNWSGGIICGLIASLFFLSFHVRKETLSLPVGNRDDFVGQVNTVLTEKGYDVEQPNADRMLGKPSFGSLLLGGTVQVQLQGNSAKLSGPKISVEALRNRLRVQSHLEKSRRSLEDTNCKLPQSRLRSVQIQFATSGQQDPTLTKDLIQALTQLGATVHCDISLLVQKDGGLEEFHIESVIRDKIKRHGLAVTVHKKPLALTHPEGSAP